MYGSGAVRVRINSMHVRIPSNGGTMSISGGTRRPIRAGTGILCREPLHLIGGTSRSDVVAVLCEAPWGISCWYNRRVMKGALLGWLDLWAQRQVVTGWRFKSLRACDLPPDLMN